MMKRSKGFTLIELLVVIAIIAVLAALLFPDMSRARDQAHEAQCISNMHQLGLAMNHYFDDWDGGLFAPYPDATYTYGSGKANKVWKDSLYSYLRSKDVFLCPTNPVGWNPLIDSMRAAFPNSSSYDKRFYQPGDETNRYPVSYATNSFLFGGIEPGGNIYDGTPPDILFRTPAYYTYSLSDIPDPSETIAIGETRWWYSCFNLQEMVWFPDLAFHHHNRFMNFVFLDSHVKKLKLLQTMTPVNMWGPGAPFGYVNSHPEFQGYYGFIPTEDR